MQIVFFSSDYCMIDEWKNRHNTDSYIFCFDIDSLLDLNLDMESTILIADYDSVAIDVNKWISSNTLPKNIIVLEKAPAITTGKMLIGHGVKAYGNARMQPIHFTQMIEVVSNNKIWTYPELTAKLADTKAKESLNSDSVDLIKNRLSEKELEVVYLVLEGLTNDAIASKLDIKTRTVKAHVGSIFSKLHINDRVSLVLLLK